MANPTPCPCGGHADLRGGLVSMRHWVECRVCGATTALHNGYSEALAAWRERRITTPPRKPHGCICPPGAEATCKGWQCPRRGLPTGSAS